MIVPMEPREVEKSFVRAFALAGESRAIYTARLGYTTVDYSRLMARDVTFYRQLAREMSAITTLSEDLLFRQMVADRNDQWMKNPRGEDAHFFRDAAERLLDLLSKFPERSRRILVLRMHGRSWRDVLKAHPDRVLYSLRDDYDRDLVRFAEFYGHILRMLL